MTSLTDTPEQTSVTSPQTGATSPQTSATSPQSSASSPQTGAALRQTDASSRIGAASPLSGDTTEQTTGASAQPGSALGQDDGVPGQAGGTLRQDGPPRPAGYRTRVRQVIETQVAPLVDAAERDRRFPREAVAAFGSAGLFAQRWHGGGHGDLNRCVTLAEELGRAGLGGIGVGLSLHLEAATGLLVRFARSSYTCSVRDRALAGQAVLCLATSEEHAGSDLNAVATELRPAPGGEWTVRGTKWFVSPGARADVALILCRADEGLAIVAVPREALHVHKRLETSGLRSLETVRLSVDATVPDAAVLVRPGLGLPAVTWGLIHERLGLAAQLVGGMSLAVSLAAVRLHRRQQFGVPLFDHQALRLRLAELSSQVTLARHGVYALAAGLGGGAAGGRSDTETGPGPVSMRDIAGAKATIAKLAQHVAIECGHLFGGAGYLEDETPFARLRRDLPMARLGAGSDEMMWEMVATGLHGDDELYDRWVSA